MSFSDSFEYKVVYARRRSMSVKIGDDNTVTVRCPVGTSKGRIEDFINSKKGWLMRHMAANASVMAQFSDVLSMKKILVGGRFYDLRVGVANNIAEGVVNVKSIAALKNLYVKALGEDFLSRFKKFARENSFVYGDVSFRTYKGRWGCCDASNNITFNYKLLMLPEELQNAVIAHELCHTKYHNHSSSFHKLLDCVFPQNRVSEKMLKRYAFVARIY